MKKEETIIESMEKIYYVWDFVSKEQARNMLKKLLMFNKLKTVEENRLVLHNLATISMKIEEEKNPCDKDMSQAKHYSKALMEMLDNHPNYQCTQLNKQRYCKALNNYAVCYSDELTNKELENVYRVHYETYKNYNYDGIHVDEYREKLISQYNLNMIKKNYSKVLETVEDFLIHNNDTQYEEAINAIIQQVKDENVMLYEQIMLLVKKVNIQAM